MQFRFIEIDFILSAERNYIKWWSLSLRNKLIVMKLNDSSYNIIK